jgi:hypothetical protein
MMQRFCNLLASFFPLRPPQAVIRDTDSNPDFICPVSRLWYAPLGVYCTTTVQHGENSALAIAEIVSKRTQFFDSGFDKADGIVNMRPVHTIPL